MAPFYVPSMNSAVCVISSGLSSAKLLQLLLDKLDNECYFPLINIGILNRKDKFQA